MKLKLLILSMLFSALSWGQVSYLGLDGGFEGTATIDNATTYAAPQAGKWAKANATQTIANETTTFRSGVNALRVNNSSGTGRRVWSPNITVASTTSQVTVQFYRRVASLTNTQESQAGIINNTEGLSGTYAVPGAINTWEKVTYNKASSTWTTIAGLFLHRQLGTGGDMFVDDMCVYTGGVDVTLPNPATVPVVNNPTGTTLDVSWTASTLLDGGAYMVVRYAVSPNADNDPNVNGIYAVGNTYNNGTGALVGTVVYNGTGTSFTDTGLSNSTTYYYKIYAYDKAYNYAAEISGNGTTGGCYPSIQASALVISNPTLDGFNVSWTAGNGNGTMIVVRLTASLNAVPVTGTPYTPNLAWGSAGQIDVNNRVIFRAAGTSAGPITGLTAGSEYTITAYAYNTAGNCYNLISPPSTVGYTLSVEPTAHAASLSCIAVSDTQIDLTFPARSTIPNARAYMILRKIEPVPTGVPTDGNFYPPATVIGDATVVGTTALDGAETSYSVTGLTPGTNYYFTLIPFNSYLSVPSSINYRTSATIPSTNCTTNTACYLADFEAPATKGAYPSGDVTLGAYVWNMSECLIGTSASDYKTGLQSARMRANANAALEMQQDKASGVSTISFNYRQFGTDTNQTKFKVEYSKDSCNSLNQI